MVSDKFNSKKSKFYDYVATILLWSVALIVLSILLLIIGYIVIKGISALSFQFIFSYPRGINYEGGIFPTIVASLYVTMLGILFAAPVGIGAAIYLSEHASGNIITKQLKFLIDSLTSVPSIVFGIFGLVFFVEILGLGRSMLSGGLTLTLMILPVILRTSEESIKAVPQSYRLCSFGLGATKWQTIKKIVLPSAFPGILTGIILGVGRAFGETAALLYTSGSSVNPFKPPLSPMDSGSTMTIHLWKLMRVNNIEPAIGTALFLLIIVLSTNLFMSHIMKNIRRRFVA